MQAMSAITCNFYARLGNNLFIYAHARAYAEQNGHELRTQPWIGEKIFTLDGAQHARPDGRESETLCGYFQAQKDLIYTRADCRRWFKLKPEVERALEAIGCVQDKPHAHIRRGDFAGAGYPVLSRNAVAAGMAAHFFMPDFIEVSDSQPFRHPAFTGDLEFLPDFYRLMKAPILFRANSTFGYWAAVLGNGRVFSPRIDGLKGGIEHDNVPYEEGNHCRCADLEFVTDLHLKEA